jgi:biopolymer transport protein ExbD
MRFTQGRRRAAPSVIIVSLIDVLLVVLIFLMVTTTFRRTPAVKIALPEARQSEAPGTSSESLTVTIDKNEPHLYLGDRPVTFERLESELAAAASRNTSTAVIIRSDKAAPVGEFVRVMNAAKLAGFRSVNVETDEPGAP